MKLFWIYYHIILFEQACYFYSLHRGVVVITIAQIQSTKPGLGLCAGSSLACGVSEICDGEDLWQWSWKWLEIKLNPFRRSIIPQKQFISIFIFIIIIIILALFIGFLRPSPATDSVVINKNYVNHINYVKYKNYVITWSKKQVVHKYKKIGPSIHPCGTPDKNIWNKLLLICYTMSVTYVRCQLENRLQVILL